MLNGMAYNWTHGKTTTFLKEVSSCTKREIGWTKGKEVSSCLLSLKSLRKLLSYKHGSSLMKKKDALEDTVKSN